MMEDSPNDLYAPLAAPRRRGLDQPPRDAPRLDQEEEADLRDVGAGGDMHQVVLLLGIECISRREVVETFIDVLKVPGITDP